MAYVRSTCWRLLATTPLWYRPDRLGYFAEMLRTLADFQVEEFHFIIITNASSVDEIAAIERLVHPFMSLTRRFSVRSCRATFGTYDLCWEHRKVIEREFLGGSYTHFMNFEDDMRLSFRNFCYFVENRGLLQGFGLIPSFLRVEFNALRQDYFYTDVTGRLVSRLTPSVRISDKYFISPLQPYCASYILDQELAREFVATRSFDLERSQEVIEYGVPERAAMGLCHENVPEGFGSRYAILIDEDRMMPTHGALIYHLPNTFTNLEIPITGFGQLSVRNLFVENL